MRIEIHTSNKNNTSISGLRTDFSSLISSSGNLIDSLNSIKRATFAMNGGVGSLKSALDSVEQRISHEETRKSNLEDARTKTDKFIELAQSADSKAAEMVSRNKNEFYRMNSWVCPYSFNGSHLSRWYNNAKKWLHSNGSKILSEYSNIWKKYMETLALSDEDFDKLCDEYLSKVQSGEIDESDTVLRAILDRLAQTELSKNMTSAQRKRIETYNRIYEELNPEKRDKMNDFFERAKLPNGFTETETEDIKFLIYKSGEPYNTLFFDYADDINFESFNGENSGWVLHERNNSNKCFYHPGTGKIHLGANHDWNNFGMYHSLFEEIGHAIDDISIKRAADGEFLTGTIKDQLDITIRSDVSKGMKKIVAEQVSNYMNDPNRMRIDKFVTNFCSEEKIIRYINREIGSGELNVAELKIAQICVSKILDGQNMKNTAYDIYGGALKISWGHDWSGKDTGTEYNPDYIYTELFSEYYANGVTSKKEDALLKEYLPESYKVLDDAVRQKVSR